MIAYNWGGVDMASPRVTVARGNRTPVIRVEAGVEGAMVTEQVAHVTTTVSGVPVAAAQSPFAVSREELPSATPQPTETVFTPPPPERSPAPVQVAAATPAMPAPAPAPAERRTIYRLVKSPPPIPLPPVPRAKPLPAGASGETESQFAGARKSPPTAGKKPRTRLAAARPSPHSTRMAVIKRADRALALVKEAQASMPATTKQIERTREWALETTGMADEAMLAAAGVDKQVAKVGNKAAKLKRKRHKKVASLAPTPQPSAPAHPAAGPGVVDDKLYAVHLASYRNPRRAYRSWQQIAARHPKLLRTLNPRIRRQDLGWKGVYYRLQLVPFAHRKAAGKLCERLKAAGTYCRVAVVQ